jgi:hypothetical protein
MRLRANTVKYAGVMVDVILSYCDKNAGRDDSNVTECLEPGWHTA